MRTISVVIPTFNRADLIPVTLDAIFNQTRKANEVIVVDDGSTDATVAQLQRVDSVRVITSCNRGDLVARNIGLKNATSNLVAFCDSDDVWEPEFIEKMERQWDEVPDMVACYSNFRILRDNVVSETTKFDSAPADYWNGLRDTGSDAGVFEFPIVERLVAFQPLFTSCMMVARDPFLALGGWDEGASRVIGCDFATALRVAGAPPLGIVKAPLVAIRKHSGNISADTERMNLGDAEVLEYVLSTRPELDSIKNVIMRSIAERRSAALASAFVRRDFAAVRAIYERLPKDFRRGKTFVKHVIAFVAQFC